ncbi:MAG: hypothetical protein JXA33_10740 [Anaerolineae bacterium]|nr:hypothetical protein [Anaerolineae bacterium]
MDPKLKGHNVRKKQQHYLSYMLRLWQVEDKDGTDWRASLENPHSSEVQGFADVEMLFEFIRGQINTTRDLSKGDKDTGN